MFLKRAMRYYRVWIYSCNLALFISTLVFIVLSLWIASDFHLSLFPSVTFYQPSFIYAYMALTLQSGILQAIGCVGANRMNERLLGLYWQMLLILLIGDIIVGVIWLFRYNLLLSNLRSDLVYRLDNDYGFDTDFQELWDRVQSEHQCCGIDSPYDYNMTQWFDREHAAYEGAQFLVPQSCCAYHRFPTLQTFQVPSPSGADEGGNGVTGSGVTSEGAGSKDAINSVLPGRSDNGLGEAVEGNSIASRTTSADCMDSYRPENIYTTGCYNSILEWLQSSFDCLSVIGFCVITFLKLCFAFILRYEIQEMIQKINLIKGDKERADSTTLQHLEAYLPRPSIQTDSNQALLSNHSPHSQQTNKRNRISNTKQSSFNSSIGSYGSNCGDSTTLNIPSRHSPQSTGSLGNTITISATSPPTNRVSLSSSPASTTNKHTTTITSTQSKSLAPSPPATLITSVTGNSGTAETTILPTSSSKPTTIKPPGPLIGLINLPLGDKSNTRSKSFNSSNNSNNNTNGNNNNQVLVTNF